MQPDHNELHGMHSPRQIVQLTHELNTAEGVHGEHFQFGEGENPFSFYDEDNKRESIQSEEEGEHSNKNIQEAERNDGEEHKSQTLPEISVGQNISSKLPIHLDKTPKNEQPESQQSGKAVKGQLSPQIKLSSFKESPFEFQKYSKTPQPSKSKPQLSSQERKYQEELQNDMQQLKNNFKGHKKLKIFDSKTDKNSKINLNKTYAPPPRLKHHQSGDMQLEEMRMLIKMAFEKKKANYDMLKDWDRKRAESMALHGKLIDQLQNEIDIRIKSSLQNFQLYQTFFREKARQQEKYVNSPVINTRYALQNNSLSKNVYINCSVILNSLYDQNVARCQRINDFIYLIHNNILKERTEKHLQSSQKELLRIRQKISTLKSSLKKYNQQTEEKANQLAKLFNDQAASISLKIDRDFYRTQLSFLRKAFMQIEVQKKLGEYCLQYYHTSIEEEIKRSRVIHEAMLTYSKGLKQAYNIEVESTEFEQMSKHEQLKLISQFYSLEEMFDERTLELLKLKNKIKTELSIEIFTNYINKFNYESFDSRVILLKEFTVRHITSGKSKQVQEEPCYLVITVDNFLHLFFNCQRNLYNKPDLTIKIHAKWLEIKTLKDELVDIVKKEEKRNSMISYFWDTKIDKTYRIKFAKKDNKEEFMDYIKKLMIDLV